MNESGKANSSSAWGFALRRLARHKLQLGLALLWSAIFVLTPMQVPVITGALIDGLQSKQVRLYGMEFKPGSHRRSVEFAVLALVVVALIRGGSVYLRQRSVNQLTRRFVRQIRQSLIERMTNMPMEKHFQIGSGQLFQGMMADTEN